MSEEPEAERNIRDYFINWLETFAGYVRAIDYASARTLFHPDVLAFGTYRDVITRLTALQTTQWEQVWPKTTDFRFDVDSAQVLISHDHSMATVIAAWISTGYHVDGTAFCRPGRATMVFGKGDGGWLCTHSHLSLNRGVPQQSFAKLP